MVSIRNVALNDIQWVIWAPVLLYDMEKIFDNRNRGKVFIQPTGDLLCNVIAITYICGGYSEIT